MDLLQPQFERAFSNINLGERVQVAKAAHEEVREYLESIAELVNLGFRTVLIGSYRRHTAIWPGKDVDIFGKFEGLDVDTASPAFVYNILFVALQKRYSGRITEQPRSIKVAFDRMAGPDVKYLAQAGASEMGLYEFSVDVVPAVRWGERWAIPARVARGALPKGDDPFLATRQLWEAEDMGTRWQPTDPEHFTQLTDDANEEFRINGDGAFCPTVRAIRQIRRAHLGSTKPGGLYYEIMLLEAFQQGALKPRFWPQTLADALQAMVERLSRAEADPVPDPALNHPYNPQPSTVELQEAADVFKQLAGDAAIALRSSRCEAAARWRRIFGQNGHADDGWVFPLPDGCAEDGRDLQATRNPLVGSNEARGFGCAK